MKSKILALIFVLLINLLPFIFAYSVEAFNFRDQSGISESGEKAGYQEANLDEDSIALVVGRLIKMVLVFLGVFFFLLTLYAGFVWMLSRGNKTDIEKAKATLQSAIIGLIIILASYSVTYYLMSAFTKPPSSK